jgi:hypothetical protein
MKELNILIFDDVERNLKEVQAAIKDQLKNEGTVEAFPLLEAVKVDGDPEPYENALLRELKRREKLPTLIVADRDLSRATNYRGLSEPTIRRVADVLGVPECGYARGESVDATSYLEIGEKREECIRLSLSPPETFARNVIDLANGFRWIEERLPTILNVLKSQQASPAKIMAALLEVPNQAEKLALFAVGDKNRLGEIPRLKDVSGEERIRRLACLLGYWLWDSILFFPGLVVNSIAAASYLDIDPQEFDKPDVRELFSKAVYSGPFAAARGPLWWRANLDAIVGEAGFTNGREFAESDLRRHILPSHCCVDGSTPAGFVCMLSNKPVSSKNSTGKLLWMPRGADLARVSRSMLDDLGPWL